MKRLILFLTIVLMATQLAAQITAAEYRARRERVAKALGSNAMLVLTSPEPAHRNGDVTYPFRQDDNLFYLTGINQTDTTLVMIPSEAQYRETLFVSDPDPSEEVWTGRLMTLDEARSVSGVAEVVVASKSKSFLEAAWGGTAFGKTDVYRYYRGPSMPVFREAVRAGRAELWLPLANRTGDPLSRELIMAADARRRYPEIAVRNAQPALVSIRELKSPAELALIQRAIDITAEAQKAAMKRIGSATNESQVQAAIEFTFLDLGANGWGFPSIVASGTNATTLHYESNHAPIDRAALLTTDIGAEVSGYSADVTRTYPASGRFTDPQRALYAAVLAAQNEVLAMMRPGARWTDLDAKAVSVIGRELTRLGLTSRNELAQTRLYLMHGVGHPLGLQVHDVFDPERRLEPGMVVTDEPGIYVRRADVVASEVFKKLPASEQASINTALDRYAGIGVRIEDDILITEGAPRLLSSGAPRTIEAIEELMAPAR